MSSPTLPIPSLPDSAAPDVLATLRAATADRHARLDSQLPIAGESAGLPDYALHLTVVRAWLAEIDRAAWSASELPADWIASQQARLQRIDADLAELAAPSVPNVPGEPLPASVPSGFGWGVAYVVEGSQLGGQMLYRRLREPLAPLALRYLQGGGIPGAWPRFTAALRAAVVTTAGCEAACAGACWAFDDLASRFEGAGAFA
ncbi:biliverdin-producing heme oxygenase [Xylophilus sp. GOD-11R]|uniref:biliverdin-producing heme oxygenase n=1 Tax=Xylophilus sp. GOD-11R TaxID=3089814 RepID=UPI00298C14B2|nr:biliverdin-producing heme oxygenase [Xylophilus sp. GOD-11R]WPB56022.1 biliverdin-producing heme oxygenase [Xylophilus sp. GOD-11R]